MGDGQEKHDHTPHPESSIEHMVEEFQEVEGDSKGRRWLHWGFGILAVVAVVVAFFLFPGEKGDVATASRSGPAVIQISEPKGSRLTATPTTFAWDSVSGRSDYVFKLFIEGQPVPLIERQTKDPKITLTQEEGYKIQAGKTYVWTITARRRDGSSIGTGKGKFTLA